MEEYFYLPKPRGIDSIKIPDLFEWYIKNPAESVRFIGDVSNDGYLYWDKVKYRNPIPGLSIEKSWLLTREIRKLSSSLIPVTTEGGRQFTWYRTKRTDEHLRKIDMHTGGDLLTSSLKTVDVSERQKYIVKGIMEEAIASSQLEGADTSRRYAKRMIAEKIKPRNQSDWMILNDYKVLMLVEDEYKNKELSLDMLVEFQRILTENTLDEEDKVGRFRADEDEIVVHYKGKIAHEPPKMKFVLEELQKLVAYANNDADDAFVHPVIKAIILHFWIGYLHPFPDGNGRTARLIFYWYLLKNGYWAFSYLSISAVIKRAADQYAHSYLYSEQDNLDFTYFYDYNIRRICLAIDEFSKYAERIVSENKLVSDALGKTYPDINDRQSQVVYYLMEDSNRATTISRHEGLSGVSRPTARMDLYGLVDVGVLETRKKGREIEFRLSENAKRILNM